MYNCNSAIKINNPICSTISIMLKTECITHRNYDINVIESDKNSLTCSVIKHGHDKYAIITFACPEGVHAEYWIVSGNKSGKVFVRDIPSYRAHYNQIDKCVSSIMSDVYSKLG